jgi:hypothetical protein
MSLDRPRAGGDEWDDEFAEVPVRASANPGAPSGSRSRTRPAKPGTSPGQARTAAPAWGSPACEPWCDCGRRAGMAGLLPPEGSRRSERRPGRGQARHRLAGASARPAAVVRWRYDWADGHVRGVDIVRVRNGHLAESLAYVKG